MSNHLRDAYLDLERAMLRLDAAGDALADEVRVVMDAVWLKLLPADIKYLNNRAVPQRAAPGEVGEG